MRKNLLPEFYFKNAAKNAEKKFLEVKQKQVDEVAENIWKCFASALKIQGVCESTIEECEKRFCAARKRFKHLCRKFGQKYAKNLLEADLVSEDFIFPSKLFCGAQWEQVENTWKLCLFAVHEICKGEIDLLMLSVQAEVEFRCG